MQSWLFGKDPNARKDWGQEEEGTTEDLMVRWHHQLSEHVFKQTPGDSEGQESLALLQSMELQGVRHDLATEQQYIIVINDHKFSGLKKKKQHLFFYGSGGQKSQIRV